MISYFIKGIKDFDVIKQLFLLQIFDFNDQEKANSVKKLIIKKEKEQEEAEGYEKLEYQQEIFDEIKKLNAIFERSKNLKVITFK
ncbi:hypothetical protein QLQ80_03015 [Mycoplasma sp. M5725]|uniref:Uncharacterized protein n=1 Tax=Mycoplasma phocimorsus TaxID=3045839 RepID=A0AAJ1UVY8_9MOLU|nr:hypothetical protein [Mycoplasma phocimorsus]MDJ1646034.1 hypothetical protein [Mycoplasma phocimorsus]